MCTLAPWNRQLADGQPTVSWPGFRGLKYTWSMLFNWWIKGRFLLPVALVFQLSSTHIISQQFIHLIDPSHLACAWPSKLFQLTILGRTYYWLVFLRRIVLYRWEGWFVSCSKFTLVNWFCSFLLCLASPKGDPSRPLSALLLDSWYDQYRGVICLVAVLDGQLMKGNKVQYTPSRSWWPLALIAFWHTSVLVHNSYFIFIKISFFLANKTHEFYSKQKQLKPLISIHHLVLHLVQPSRLCLHY